MCVALQTRATTPRYSCTTTSDASLARSISPLSGLDLVGRFRNRRVDDHTVKIDVHFSIDDRLPWQHLRRRIPRPLLDDAILNRFCDQSSNLFTHRPEGTQLSAVYRRLRACLQRNFSGLNFPHTQIVLLDSSLAWYCFRRGAFSISVWHKLKNVLMMIGTIGPLELAGLAATYASTCRTRSVSVELARHRWKAVLTG